jgi:flagellar basal body-associated protein FliL
MRGKYKEGRREGDKGIEGKKKTKTIIVIIIIIFLGIFFMQGIYT